MRYVVLFFIFTLAAQTSAAAVDIPKLIKVIEQSEEIIMRSLREDSSSLAGSTSIAIKSNDVYTAEVALITNWLNGENSELLVELTWWRSTLPELRFLAAALLLTGKDENTADVPFLDASRFTDPEKSARLSELKLVDQSASKVGSALKRLVAVTYEHNSNKYKDALKLRFSKY